MAIGKPDRFARQPINHDLEIEVLKDQVSETVHIPKVYVKNLSGLYSGGTWILLGFVFASKHLHLHFPKHLHPKP